EDGIRDRNVTGVQTCALPILLSSQTTNAHQHKTPTQGTPHQGNRCTLPSLPRRRQMRILAKTGRSGSGRPEDYHMLWLPAGLLRSEERRVGKESRSSQAAGVD